MCAPTLQGQIDRVRRLRSGAPRGAFAGLRAVLAGRGFPGREIALTFALDAIYLVACAAFFSWMLRQVRARGLLSRFGE